MRLKQAIVIGVAMIGLSAGCAHKVKKADIAATANPGDEIMKLETDVDLARSAHVDVLAPKDFKAARKALLEAKEDTQEGDSQDEILESIAYGRGYLERANQTAHERRPMIEAVLRARDSAIKAGARNHPQHDNQLVTIDDDVRDNVDDLGDLTPREVSRLQNLYLDLELATIQSNQLGQARAMIEGAKEREKAKRDAPKTLRQSEVDLTVAENEIAAGRNRPEMFAGAVSKANESAKYLVEVLAAAHSSKSTLSEDVAINIVNQNRKIANLQGRVGEKETEAEKLSRAMALEREKMSGEMAAQAAQIESKNRELASAGQLIEVQKAIETARTKFKEDEAEAYQQGNKLVIRLKSMNFPSGRSDLPPKSMALLAKVKEVTSDLNPQSVVVEGHTDSVGSAKMNEKISQQRADAVASYLSANGFAEEKVEAAGYGFKRPIASNKTKEGRSQNRRVDIVITPTGAAASATDLSGATEAPPRAPANEAPVEETMQQ